jgi:uncharacterized membrane protein
MAQNVSHRPVSIVDRPIYALLLPFPIVCFLGALLTDLSYQGSGGNLIWLNFSSWLIAAGLVIGAFAVLFLLIDAVRLGRGLPGFGLLLAAWIVELINSFVHARDGWTAVVPIGLTLSVIATVLVLLSGWFAAGARIAVVGERP